MRVFGGRSIRTVATNHIAVIRDTHGKTSHLNTTEIDDLSLYLRSLQ